MALMVTGGFGFASLDFGRQVSVAMHTPAGAFIARLAETWSFVILESEQSSRDIALLYGFYGGGPTTWARAALGVGIVDGARHGALVCGFFCSHELEPYDAVGLAAQLDAVWAPWTQVGIGLSAFGNLNGPGSFGGATLNLYLGRVR